MTIFKNCIETCLKTERSVPCCPVGHGGLGLFAVGDCFLTFPWTHPGTDRSWRSGGTGWTAFCSPASSRSGSGRPWSGWSAGWGGRRSRSGGWCSTCSRKTRRVTMCWFSPFVLVEVHSSKLSNYKNLVSFNWYFCSRLVSVFSILRIYHDAYSLVEHSGNLGHKYLLN